MWVDKHASETLKRVDKQVYEIVEPTGAEPLNWVEYQEGTVEALRRVDREVYRLLGAEYDRQRNTLPLIAAENYCSRAVLAALGSVVQNKTTEGFVGGRFHGGCQVVDALEALAVKRARKAFKAQYANVQPHSGTSANQIVLTAVLDPPSADPLKAGILSLGMDQGGHVSHGAGVSFAGRFFEVEHYCVDRDSLRLDYDAIRTQARRFRPKMIVCGASAYSRTIDFAEFRAIADEVGAYLMADISHISGLVIAGVHPSPVDHAHFTTTSTYKPGGPRGGLIVMGKDFERPIQTGKRSMPLWERIEKATFPGFQGTPYLNNVAAKAVFLRETLSDEYRQRQFGIIENARTLGRQFLDLGYDVLTGGTDNHMFLVNVANFRPGLTGVIAQKCLEDCGIIVNMNRLPYDPHSARITSGVRFGTPIVTRNGMGPAEMEIIAHLVDGVLTHVEMAGEKEYRLPKTVQEETAARVQQLCAQFLAW